MSQPNPKTLMFYRRLLHTMMKTFDKDPEMFHRCRIDARKKIMENSQEQDKVKIQDHIFFGEEIRDFLTKNMIQGTLTDTGNYKFKAKKEHGFGVQSKPYPKEK